MSKITLFSMFSLFDFAIVFSQSTDGEYRDIVHPINQEVRDMMEEEIIKAYNEAE